MNANQPAFPIKGYCCEVRISEGLTKREYFAAMAMQGLLAADGQLSSHEDTELWTAAEIADYAVEQADALLAELERS